MKQDLVGIYKLHVLHLDTSSYMIFEGHYFRVSQQMSDFVVAVCTLLHEWALLSYFRAQASHHKIHENIAPRKLPALRYLKFVDMVR